MKELLSFLSTILFIIVGGYLFDTGYTVFRIIVSLSVLILFYGGFKIFYNEIFKD